VAEGHDRGCQRVGVAADYLEGLMKHVESAATRIANNCGAEVVDSFLDFVE